MYTSRIYASKLLKVICLYNYMLQQIASGCCGLKKMFSSSFANCFVLKKNTRLICSFNTKMAKDEILIKKYPILLFFFLK